MAETTYDVIVLGAGAVGENVADRAGRTGLGVAIVDNELVGGECSYWACMPTKALLRPGAVLAAARSVDGAAQAVAGELDRQAVLARRDTFAHGWDDSSQVDWLEETGITLVRGRARFDGPRRVLLDDGDGIRTLVARYAVVIATGSAPTIPEIPGLADLDPWTSRDATSVQDIPRSLVIIGGGVVAAEMATAFADLGAQVTMLVRGERLLDGTEPFAGESVARGLQTLGVDVRLRTSAARASRTVDGIRLHLGSGGHVDGERVLVATGRHPRTRDLGLETLGLDAEGALAVDDAGRVETVGGGWLYAAGDVTGRTATTHQGKYDARVTGDVIAQSFGGQSERVEGAEAWSPFRATADHVAVPQVVFTRPEVASVGLTEAAAAASGIRTRTVQVALGSVAGASVSADGYEGTAMIVVDLEREVVVGATFVGPEVAELLHAATIAVVGEVPLRRLWHAVPAYPTVSEVWLRLLEAYGL